MSSFASMASAIKAARCSAAKAACSMALTMKACGEMFLRPASTRTRFFSASVSFNDVVDMLLPFESIKCHQSNTAPSASQALCLVIPVLLHRERLILQENTLASLALCTPDGAAVQRRNGARDRRNRRHRHHLPAPAHDCTETTVGKLPQPYAMAADTEFATFPLRSRSCPACARHR